MEKAQPRRRAASEASSEAVELRRAIRTGALFALGAFALGAVTAVWYYSFYWRRGTRLTSVIAARRAYELEDTASAALSAEGRRAIEAGDLVGAETLFRRALALRADHLGRTHVATLDSMEELASLLWHRGGVKQNETETLLRDVWQLQTDDEERGPLHNRTICAQIAYGELLLMRDKLRAAEVCFAACVECISDSAVPERRSDTHLTRVVRNLAAAIERQGRPGEATSLLEKHSLS